MYFPSPDKTISFEISHKNSNSAIMRRILTVILCFTSLTLLFSCSSSKKMSNYVPFTRDLKQKLEKDNIDLKQVQFYVDQKLILNRNLGDQKLVVSSGVVKMENGKYALAFGPGSGYTFNNYVLYGTEWMNGTTLVNYDSEKFRARCGTCSDIASALLVIRKKELDKFERKSRTVTGRTVGN